MARVSISVRKGKEYTPEQKAEVKKEIKRLNTQIRAVAKKYGTDSDVYKSVVAPFVSDKYLSDPSRLVHMSKPKAGEPAVIQLKESAGLLETKTGRSLLLSGRSTYTSITELETESKKEVAADIAAGIFGEGLKGKELQQAIQEEVRLRTEQRRSLDTHLQALKTYVYGKYTDRESRKILSEISTGKGKGSASREDIEKMLKRLEPRFGLDEYKG